MSSDRAPARRRRGDSVRVLLWPALLAGLACAPAWATSTPLAADAASPDEAISRTAAWPFFKPHHRPIHDSLPCPVTPHPAVARIIAPEKGATAYGSGTLVDVRDNYGLVVTNWHVVRDATGVVEVVFPNGFRSHARPLKVDSDWDLAALVIWRPPIEPVKLAAKPPRPGDLLTIHGHGQGQYRIATGRCTAYYAPHVNFPQEMVELDVEARQGDSGGPIFNQCGELAGVLFGAGQGTTLGSFGPRVSNFLATLAPDIGQAKDQALVAAADRPAPDVQPLDDGNWSAAASQYPSSPWSPPNASIHKTASGPTSAAAAQLASASANDTLSWSDLTSNGWYDPLKSLLAVIGIVAIGLRLVRLVK